MSIADDVHDTARRVELSDRVAKSVQVCQSLVLSTIRPDAANLLGIGALARKGRQAEADSPSVVNEVLEFVVKQLLTLVPLIVLRIAEEKMCLEDLSNLRRKVL